jgi:hypothetical protein
MKDIIKPKRIFRLMGYYGDCRYPEPLGDLIFEDTIDNFLEHRLGSARDHVIDLRTGEIIYKWNSEEFQWERKRK